MNKDEILPNFEALRRTFVFNGLILFLLGLIIGLVEGHVSNPRMGLAAHLEGLMNGIYLIALGSILGWVRLPPSLFSLAFWTTIYGAYANLAVTVFASLINASSFSPITGAGLHATLVQEYLVSFGFVTVGIAMLVSTCLFIFGMRKAIQS